MYKRIRSRKSWDIIDTFRYGAVRYQFFLWRRDRATEEETIHKFLDVIRGGIDSAAYEAGYGRPIIGDPVIVVRDMFDRILRPEEFIQNVDTKSDTEISITLQNRVDPAKTVMIKMKIFNSVDGGTIECEAEASGDYAKRSASYFFNRSLDYNMKTSFFRGVCALLARKFINVSLLSNEELGPFVERFPNREITIVGKPPRKDFI